MEQLTRLMRKHRTELEEPFAEIWALAVQQQRPCGPIGTAYKVLQEWG